MSNLIALLKTEKKTNTKLYKELCENKPKKDTITKEIQSLNKNQLNSFARMKFKNSLFEKMIKTAIVLARQTKKEETFEIKDLSTFRGHERY